MTFGIMHQAPFSLSLLLLLLLLLEIAPLTVLDLTKLPKLDGQRAPGMALSLLLDSVIISMHFALLNPVPGFFPPT